MAKDHPQHPDPRGPDERLPDALKQALRGLYTGQVAIPQEIDARVRVDADAHFRSAEEPTQEADDLALPGALRDSLASAGGGPRIDVPAATDGMILSSVRDHFQQMTAAGKDEAADDDNTGDGAIADAVVEEEIASIPPALQQALRDYDDAGVAVPSSFDDRLLGMAWEHLDQSLDDQSLPGELTAALRGLYTDRLTIPQATDEAVLQGVAEQFGAASGLKLRRTDRQTGDGGGSGGDDTSDDLQDMRDEGGPIPITGFFQRHGALLARAAVVALFAGVAFFAYQNIDQNRKIPQRFAKGDIDRDGQTNILDAFAVARVLRDKKQTTPDMDMNEDGVVDQADVDALANQAVRLEDVAAAFNAGFRMQDPIAVKAVMDASLRVTPVRVTSASVYRAALSFEAERALGSVIGAWPIESWQSGPLNAPQRGSF